MSDPILYRRADGDPAQLDASAFASFAAGIRGGVLTPTDIGYDTARSIWNAMVDRRPALIARCLGAQDVRNAVTFARDHGVPLSVRGGGHNIAGSAVVDGGLMIDLSAMRTVRVDPERRTARVAAGALLGDFDHEAQAFGLATPLGINSTTGVAGLCLGGGFGWLTRQYGMTIDNLLSADVVTADGRLQTVSATQEPELFWALRGGGGNFGVVTSFEFRLHPIGPEVWSGLVVYRASEARSVLRAWRDFTAESPDELSVWAILRKAPPLPFLPESEHGRDIVALAVFYAGDMDAGRQASEPVLRFGTPIGNALMPHPYAAFQQAFDPLLAPGARNYWKSHDFGELTDEALDTALAAAARLPGPQCEIFFGQVGGAMARVPVADTAYAGRDARYVMNVHGRWNDSTEDDAGISWARQSFHAMTPFATGGVYVNFLTADESDRVAAAYGPNYKRLQAAKRHYDPDNLFRANQNIMPAAMDRVA
jgi:FAD/FMN-containing dehydrogenase